MSTLFSSCRVIRKEATSFFFLFLFFSFFFHPSLLTWHFVLYRGLLSGYARKYEYKMCEICGRAFWCKCGKKIEEVEDGEIGEKKGERVVTEKEDE